MWKGTPGRQRQGLHHHRLCFCFAQLLLPSLCPFLGLQMAPPPSSGRSFPPFPRPELPKVCLLSLWPQVHHTCLWFTPVPVSERPSITGEKRQMETRPAEHPRGPRWLLLRYIPRFSPPRAFPPSQPPAGKGPLRSGFGTVRMTALAGGQYPGWL